MSRKLALIIGNSEYDDSSLAQLVTPAADVAGLAAVLKLADIGSFDEVLTLINEPATTVRRETARFFSDAQRKDLLLLYFSGHGVLDDRGKLYLAVKDTERNLLRGTAIEASFITDVMDGSFSRQQVLILDCCHSGAFARGGKGATGASVGTAQTFQGTSSGRVVLTATDATQYAWEGDQVIGQAQNSVFTHYLIEGLRTGEADVNADGRITLDELYQYVHDQVVKVTPKQNPRLWSFNQEGEIVIARNPQPVPAPSVSAPTASQTTVVVRHTPAWSYGRLIVLFLLMLGLCGPWFAGCQSHPQPYTGAEVYQTLLTTTTSSNTPFLEWLWGASIPITVVVLFCVTLLRLGRWRFNRHRLIVGIERAAAVLTFINIGARVVFYSSSGTSLFDVLQYGFYATGIAIILAPLNLLGEGLAQWRDRRKRQPTQLDVEPELPWRLIFGLLVLGALLGLLANKR